MLEWQLCFLKKLRLLQITLWVTNLSLEVLINIEAWAANERGLEIDANTQPGEIRSNTGNLSLCCQGRDSEVTEACKCSQAHFKLPKCRAQRHSESHKVSCQEKMELCLLGFQKEGFHPGSHWNGEVIHIFSHPFWSLGITVTLF